MGFETGFFRDEMLTGEVLPPWLSGIRCEDADTELSSCQRSGFGDTSSCGTAQRLFCLSSRVSLSHARKTALASEHVCFGITGVKHAALHSATGHVAMSYLVSGLSLQECP